MGIFIVLNVGMFFLFKMTQPKSAVLDAALHGDSTAVHVDDSTLVSDDQEFDEAPESVNDGGEASPEATPIDSTEKHDTTEPTNDLAKASETSGEQKADVTTDNSDAELAVDEVADSAAASEDELALNEAPKSTAEISKLAKLLEGMKPSEAAVIAERLPTETIVQLVMRMKSRNGAKMMASLPVPVAASVATRMAELSGVKSPS
ncbi:MAG: hypothetical protein IPP40_06795 [bacterium]|nr:hypothetical protein [bacterium]